MSDLCIVTYPHPALRSRSEPFTTIDDSARKLADEMLDLMYEKRGIGIAANMVGVTKRLIIVDIQADGNRDPLICFNPVISEQSTTRGTNEEASLSIPGVSAEITRPDSIKIEFLDRQGKACTLTADGWLATVIQHEMDYLDGRTYLDHLSKMKRDRLIKKMQKFLKQAHHSCSDPHCGHDHH